MDEPWAWWRSLGSPATVCAPMVDQSERAFRLLVRRHGCDLCYTPMLHADLVVRDAAYRRDHVPDDACAEDRPLIAQLGGGDPATLAAAAREIAARGGCDAIDVNLGCPQARAARGYGAFLDDDGAARAVRAVAEASPLPATAKIRCRAAGDAEGLDVDVAATVALAERLVAAGAAAVCVHARTRAGKTFAEACWPAVRAVVAAVGAAVPVVANGGVRRAADAAALRRATGCAAVMSAEALLADPWLFPAAPAPRPAAGAACARTRAAAAAPVSWARAHVVAMLHAALARDAERREAAAAARTGPSSRRPCRTTPARCGRATAPRRTRRPTRAPGAGPGRAPPGETAARDRAGREARREPRLPSRQRRAVAGANLRLCGCGEPAKAACAWCGCRAALRERRRRSGTARRGRRRQLACFRERGPPRRAAFRLATTRLTCRSCTSDRETALLSHLILSKP